MKANPAVTLFLNSFSSLVIFGFFGGGELPI
jgi:hypothetical protein